MLITWVYLSNYLLFSKDFKCFSFSLGRYLYFSFWDIVLQGDAEEVRSDAEHGDWCGRELYGAHLWYSHVSGWWGSGHPKPKLQTEIQVVRRIRKSHITTVNYIMYFLEVVHIPDASRWQPPTPQDFGCISFVWGLSREICQKADVVWFENLQSLWWSSQLGDSNVHLKATAVLLGLQDLGGKLTTGSHIGVILGPSLAILRVMLKLSRAMAGHAEAICQTLLGHIVGFVPPSALPQKHQDF